MPKFAIHRPDIPHEAGTIYLGLIDLDRGSVMLAAVDENGECLLDRFSETHAGGLLSLTQDGRIARALNIMPALGIDLDSAGRLILDEYTEQVTAARARGPDNKAALKPVSVQCPPGHRGEKD